jgi:hypothetical protein
MPGRGPLTFKKRQREQQLKDKQAEKLARRLERKQKPVETEEQSAGFPASGEPQSHDPGQN